MKKKMTTPSPTECRKNDVPLREAGKMIRGSYLHFWNLSKKKNGDPPY